MWKTVRTVRPRQQHGRNVRHYTSPVALGGNPIAECSGPCTTVAECLRNQTICVKLYETNGCHVFTWVLALSYLVMNMQIFHNL